MPSFDLFIADLW